MLLTLALLVAPPLAVPAPAAEEKRICRRARTTGSRLPEKPICKTKAEWDEFNKANQADLAKRERDTMNTGGYNSGIDSGRLNLD